MIRIVILTHGLFGEELLRTAEMIVGKQDAVDVISIEGSVSMSEATKKLESLMALNDHKYLVFTDMFGGSPANISMAYLASNVEVVSGVNLPMLLKAFTLRMKKVEELKEFAEEIVRAGVSSIKMASTFLSGGK